MGRRRRLNIRGATYHVMARGNRKQVIFLCDSDRARFLQILADAADRYGVLVLAYCLMGNHFHLVVLTPHGNLSTFMRQLDGVFTQYFNWRYEQVGHLLQGPFKCVMVENDQHLLTALAYVVMNPVEAGFAGRPDDWEWSSYGAMAGLCEIPSFLSLDWIDGLFPAATRAESQQRFAQILSGDRNWQSYLDGDSPAVGSAAFRERIRSYIGEVLFKFDVPRSYKALFRPSLGDLFHNVTVKPERESVIQRAHVIHGYRLAEIARYLDLHPNSVSRILCRLRRSSKARGNQG